VGVPKYKVPFPDLDLWCCTTWCQRVLNVTSIM